MIKFPSKVNPADILTKPLPTVKFKDLLLELLACESSKWNAETMWGRLNIIELRWRFVKVSYILLKLLKWPDELA